MAFKRLKAGSWTATLNDATLELLALVVERIEHMRLLLVVTSRPDVQPDWIDHPVVSVQPLGRFDRRQANALIDGVAGGSRLSEAVRDQIIAHADGVPLFVEELTKTVLESGLLKDRGDRYELDGLLPPLAIPSTLQDSLMARLDRLAPVKEVAQIGACIGREFSHELLAAVSPMSERLLDEALKQLVHSQLVFQHGAPPQETYTFKHALVQDAAYGSLLKSRRQVLHKSIAEILEQRFSERVSNEPEAVAHHYTEAGLNEQATDYWLKAGQRGVERFANAEAISHLNRGLKTLEALPLGKDRDRRELLLQINLGNALGWSKGYTPPEVGRAFGRARELCDGVGDMPQMIAILYGLWIYYVMRAEYHSSGEMDEQILVLARQSQDTGALVVGHSTSCTTELFKGNFARAIEHADLGWDTFNYEEHRNLGLIYGFNPGPLCHDFAAWALLIMGYPEARIRDERPVDVRMTIHPVQRQMDRKVEQHLER
jgi:hypothetical protein